MYSAHGTRRARKVCNQLEWPTSTSMAISPKRRWLPTRGADPQPVSSDGFEDFLMSLLAASNPVMPVGLSLFSSTSSNFAPKKAVVPSQKVPPGLRSLYRGVEGFKSLDEVYTAATHTMKLDHKDVERIGNVTKLQSKSLVWNEQRAGRITSSVSHSVLRTSTSKPSQCLIKSTCCDRPSKLKTTAMMWGNEHEQVARQQDADGAVSSVRSDLKVNNCGLLIRREQPFLAASPDAMLACSCHGMGVLEIKMSVEEMSEEKDSCLDQNLELKESPVLHATSTSDVCDWCKRLPCVAAHWGSCMHSFP
ncbi:hypothetical protein KUCAC02_022239 [Chaenocephalus aceratus]|nr:hypothetical protein KUCAC02_022239 [Chaenocephalus aceratus]